MNELLTEDTEDGLEVEPCWMSRAETRHGRHTWTAETAGGHGDRIETDYRCEGYGIVTVSYSEIDAFRQCPYKHELNYGQRWQKEPKDSTATGTGGLWHRVLEVHYKTIQSVQERDGDGHVYWNVSEADLLIACKDAVESLFTEMAETEQRDPEVITILKWMYAGHLEMWGLDEGWDILAVENTLIVPLYEADGSESWVRLKVKLDLLIRDERGRVWIVDHKSGGSLPQGKDFDWAVQFGLYTYAMRHAGVKILGSIHSAAKRTMNKGDLIKPGDDGYKASMKEQTLEQRFVRRPLNYTEAQLATLAADVLADAKLAHSEANHKRRNQDEERCQWRCDFTEACMLGWRSGDDSKTLQMLHLTGFKQEPMRH